MHYTSLLEEDLLDAAELYCRAFTGEGFSNEEKESALRNIQKHTTYEGYTGMKATDQDGRLAGFAYGYKSLPGQFYRGKLEEQMTQDQADFWLNDCFEFVELAVDLSYKRRGVGSSLHDKLFEVVRNSTAVLTTSISNISAVSLYEKKRWKIIKDHAPVISSRNLQVIMGRESPSKAIHQDKQAAAVPSVHKGGVAGRW